MLDTGAASWRDYFRVNTDHKVIGVQYTVTTFGFFMVAGLMAMLMRAELARPGIQYTDSQTYNSLFSAHGTMMLFLFIIPMFAGIDMGARPVDPPTRQNRPEPRREQFAVDILAPRSLATSGATRR
jgi:hypothetical protein